MAIGVDNRRMFMMVALGLRAFGAIALSLLLGVIGLVLVWVALRFSDYHWLQYLLIVWVSSAGFGAGLGSFLVWLNPESGRRNNAIYFGVLVGLGFLGAWVGYFYKTTFDPGPAYDIGNPILSHALIGGTVLPNAVSISIGVYRQVRYGLI